MKDTILWLHLQPRNKSDGKDLYSNIKDMSQWIKRNLKLKTGMQARLYFQLLIEVNKLEMPVHERLIFLEQLHSPVLAIIDKLSKKYSGSSLPLAEDKSKFVEVANTFWSEMATGYKIIIDELSESSFFTSFFKQKANQKDLTSALHHVLYYLNSQLYSNYMLYSDCSENVWRDIHQVYHFASKRNLINKTIKHQLFTKLTIADLYKKILLFSLANPYHLSTIEMELVWSYLDQWSKYTHVNLDTAQVLKKKYPFIIRPYSDQAPSSNDNSDKIIELDLSDFTANSVWGMETKKLINHLEKRSKHPELSAHFLEYLLRGWMGYNTRQSQRNELIEPVVIAVGVSCISQFLSQIDAVPKVLKLGSEQNQKFESTTSVHSFYQAYLMDESKKGIRLKLNHHSQKAISPTIGEIIAVKHIDNSIQVGYLRWMRESPEGDIEFGIEHLSTMAEPVQLSKSSSHKHQGDNQKDKMTVLDSFIFPGGKEHQFKPILFTHAFVEKFYNSRTEHLILTHKTGSINIKLVQKVNKILDYSLYLFEKADSRQFSTQKKNKKSDQFEEVWDKI